MRKCPVFNPVVSTSEGGSTLTVDDQMRRRFLFGFLGAVVLIPLLLLVGPLVIPSVGQPTPPTTQPPPAACGQDVHFYSYDVQPEFNGPAAPTEVEAAKAELHARRCADPALTAQHASYLSGFFAGTQALLDTTNGFMADRKSWTDTVALMEIAEKSCTASVEEMSGPYKTMYMQKTQPVPSSYPADPDRPSYQVLRFSCQDGSVWNYKLDCGFQPVGQFPPPPPPPSADVPPGQSAPPRQPVTPPGRSTPPCTNCVPPSIPPTVPPTSPPSGKPYVPPSPGQCADPAGLCQPGSGPSTPRPPDSQQPTATVVPPTSVVPPPAPTVAPRPTHTVTIVSPTSVPS